MDILNEGRWFVVMNPMAGSNAAASLWKRISSGLDKAGIEYDTLEITPDIFARDVVKDAVGKGFRKFIAVGGDGTVHQVLSGMRMSPRDCGVLTLAVIPVGSGNDWVRLWNIPRDVDSAIDVIRQGHTRMQDVGRVALSEGSLSGVAMMNVAGVGLDAYVCERVNRLKSEGKRGRMIYLRGLLGAFLHYKSVRAEVLCDGRRAFRGRMLSMSVGNGKYSGGGMKQTPLARPDDGMFDVTIIRRMPWWKLLRKVGKLFDGTIMEDPYVVTARCRRIMVKCSPVSLVEVDGEVAGVTPCVIEVEPLSIAVVVPEGSDPDVAI